MLSFLKKSIFTFTLAGFLLLAEKSHSQSLCEVSFQKSFPQTLIEYALDGASKEGLNVMVIDYYEPDVDHPGFLTEEGRSIIQPLDLKEEVRLSSQKNKRDPESREDKEEERDRLSTRRARFVTWWQHLLSHSDFSKLYNKVFSLRSSLMAAATGGLVTSLVGEGHFWDSFTFYLYGNTTYLTTIMLPFYGQMIRFLPQTVDLKTAKIRENQIHATHVSGTISSHLSPEKRDLLKLFFVDFEDLHLDLEHPVEEEKDSLKSRKVKMLIENIKSSKKIRFHSYEDEAKYFISAYYESFESYFLELSDFIQKNKIAAVNMSYASNKNIFLNSLRSLYGKSFGINPTEATQMLEGLNDFYEKMYRKLFQSCPETAFFIAAGNDGKSVLEMKYAFQEINEPNVFVVAAASERTLELASFSTFASRRKAPGKVDSAGFGVDQWSYLPGGYKGRLSGTSMATPYMMNIYILLKSAASELSLQEAFLMLKKGSIHSESLRSEVESGGITHVDVVFSHFLLYQIQKQGFLKDFNLTPILFVNSKRLPNSLEKSSTTERGRSYPARILDFFKRRASSSNSLENVNLNSMPELDLDLNADDFNLEKSIQSLENLSDKDLESLIVSFPLFLLSLQNKVLNAFWFHIQEFQKNPDSNINLNNVQNYSNFLLERLSQLQKKAQAFLVPYFMDSSEQNLPFADVKLIQTKENKSFREYLDKQLKPHILSKEITNSFLIEVLSIIRNLETKPSPEEYDELFKLLEKEEVKPHHLLTMQKRIRAFHPEAVLPPLKKNP